jgi:hypothetical protein
MKLKQIIQEELQIMLHEQEDRMSSDQARDKAISTLRQLSGQVGNDDVTNFLVDVKKWINWTLGEKS